MEEYTEWQTREQSLHVVETEHSNTLHVGMKCQEYSGL
jgi:hypothetical protein